MLADDLRQQLCRLIPALGVGRQADVVLGAFDALCSESLAIEAEARSPHRSRINADGTPFQVSLDLRRGRDPALQFLGEAGSLHASAATRWEASIQALHALGAACDVRAEAQALLPVLRGLVPPALNRAEVPASLCWFAVRVPPGGLPALTVYVNAAWDRDAARWTRIEALADTLASGARWRALLPQLSELTPLGIALSPRQGERLRARVYLRAYGQPLGAYRALLTAASASAVAPIAFDACADALVAAGVERPTQSVVFSVDLGDPPEAGAKVEFCGHCLFTSDREAEQRIRRWLAAAGLDDAPYCAAVGALTEGHEVPAPMHRASLHAFAGVGVRGDEPYASIYLNPGAVLGSS